MHTNSKITWASTVILQHVHKPLLAIVVVKQRGVKARRVDVKGLRPRSFDTVGGDDIVWVIFEGTVLALDIRVYQPKLVSVV